jgi:lysine 6-dehydrogenase
MKPELGDILIMTVDVAGKSQGDDVGFRYCILEKFDKDRNVTAMARTTAYTASIVGQKLMKGLIEEKGVVPPEKLGMNVNVFEEIISELETRNVKVDDI